MRKICSVLFFFFCISTMASAGQFERVAFIDPYGVLRVQSDTTGLAPASYYSQMATLGVTMSVSCPDSISTANQYGIKIIGQDDDLLLGDYWNFDTLVHRGHVYHSETEATDTLLPNRWQHWNGVRYDTGNGVPVGWICRNNIDDSGLALSTGYSIKYNRTIYPRFKMMVWDTSGTDTLCRIHLEWGNSYIGWQSTNWYIRGRDFDSPGAWKTFDHNYFGTISALSQSTIDMNIYWNGRDSLAFDRIDFYDYLGHVLELATNSMAQSAFQAFYSRINTANHGRFYPSDEPYPGQYYGLKFFNDNAKVVSPYHQAVDATPVWLMPLLVHNINPQEVFIFDYPINSNDSATTSDSSTSIQTAYNELTSVLKNSGGYIRSQGKPFWIALQAGRSGSIDTLHHYHFGQRDVTPTELKTMINLSLAYGASGISYFVYATLYYSNSVYQQRNMDEDKALYELPPLIADTLITHGGLVDWVPGNVKQYIPNAKWYAARDANYVIDSLWPILENNWQAADNWHNIRTVSNSNIDSVYSTTFPYDSTYIEVARFRYSNDDYYMFINRRTKSTDGQNFVIKTDSSLGTVEFYDPYRDSTYVMFDSLGVVKFSAHLDPGEMRLYRIKQKAWQGQVSGTWPAYSTNFVVGDLTIDSAETLTISQNVTLRTTCKSDACNGGSDGQRVEIIVKGQLRAVGTATHPIVFRPVSTASDGGWYGIEVLNHGSAIIRYDSLINTYIGYTNTSADTLTRDTLMNTVFSGMYWNGVYLTNRNMRVSDLKFCNHVGQPTGMYLDSVGYEISNCCFDSVFLPVYVYRGTPTLSHFLIDSCRYGFWLDNEASTDSLKLRGDTIIGSTLGGVMIHGDYSKVSIVKCAFNNTTGYGIFNYYPHTHCRIDSCHFVYPASLLQAWVVSNGTNTDLSGSKYGKSNTFHVPYPVIECNWVLYSYSSTGNTTLATYCQWDDCTYLNQLVHRYDTTVQIDPKWGMCRYEKELALDAEAKVPDKFEIEQNYPNPFNPSTVIKYSLPTLSHVQIKIYNVLGQVIADLVDQDQAAGAYEATWDGRDNAGKAVASGMYFYQMIAGDFVSSKKMLMLK